jgi:hypothetical protein
LFPQEVGPYPPTEKGKKKMMAHLSKCTTTPGGGSGSDGGGCRTLGTDPFFYKWLKFNEQGRVLATRRKGMSE